MQVSHGSVKIIIYCDLSNLTVLNSDRGYWCLAFVEVYMFCLVKRLNDFLDALNLQNDTNIFALPSCLMPNIGI